MDLAELERQTRELVGPGVYDYIAGGAEDEVTLAGNLAAWRRIRLRPRVLRGVDAVETATTVLGTPVRAPLLMAPSGRHRLLHPEGEKASLRGTQVAGSLLVLSTYSTVSIEDVAAAAPEAPRWFQLYITRDRGWTAELVGRAAAAGYSALVLTVDVPVAGLRPRAEQSPFRVPAGLTLANAPLGTPAVAAWNLEQQGLAFDASLTFRDLDWLNSLSKLPLVVKGILRSDDARACLDAGAAAIVVSNHGGRQLDTAVASAEVLPAVVDEVRGEAEVYVDGGIRHGNDVLKAVAMGARAAMIGRPPLWGLATGGAEGVAAVFDYFRTELQRSMALCGARTLAELGPDLLA